MYIVDMYLRVRRACLVDGMSIREASRVFGLHRDTVRKMLSHPVPPGYRRKRPPRRPKLEPYTGVIDRILEDDRSAPKKQRHTAKRIFDRLRDEHGFDGGYTIVKDYVRERRRVVREMFVPLEHPPGHAQCDFGQAWATIGGEKRRIHYFVMSLPHSDGICQGRGNEGPPGRRKSVPPGCCCLAITSTLTAERKCHLQPCPAGVGRLS